jgi:hypothetical protein
MVSSAALACRMVLVTASKTAAGVVSNVGRLMMELKAVARCCSEATVSGWVGEGAVATGGGVVIAGTGDGPLL